MKVVAVVAQKGGAGKTTLTLSLAVAAERTGRSSVVVDLDPQTSAVHWSDRREVYTPVVVSATPARLDAVLSTAEGQGADMVFIDSPPRLEAAAMAAARAADLVVVPTRPAVVDLETVGTTVQLVKAAGDKPVVVVLTFVPSRGPRGYEAKGILADMGLNVCRVTIGNRVSFDYASAAGQTVQELEPRSKAADEITLVYNFTRRQLNK